MRRIILAAVVAFGVLAVAAPSALAYTNEGAFVATTNYSDRSGFIIDQAQWSIRPR